VIEVKNLTKSYGKNIAVSNATFTINKGEIVGFLGPNGAGKSTIMNIITGYLSSSEGTVLINGIDILDKPIEAKKHIGYLPESPPLCDDMTVDEYLNFVSEIKKVNKLEQEKDIEKIKEIIKIKDVEKRLIKNLSKGYRQRVGLAQALIGSPSILILDEPTSGLDPKQIIDMRSLIKSLGKKHTVILSSHILSEINAICDRVLIINKGNLVAEGTPENLAQGMNIDGKIALKVEAPEKKLEILLKNIKGIKSIVTRKTTIEGILDVIVQGDVGIEMRREIFYSLSKADYPILQMRSIDLNLEDIFLQFTEGYKEE